MTPGEAERGGLLQLVAGSDTTATALRAAVLFVATSPPVVARLRSEMAAADTLLNCGTRAIISNAKARSIPYLMAVIRESLRLHPPVIGALEKMAGPDGDVLPDGRRIPPGTKIQISIWAILRDEEVYGLDADCFRPERWLEVDAESEQKKRMDRSTDLVFSAGRFICMGRDIALTQLLKVISEVRSPAPSGRSLSPPPILSLSSSVFFTSLTSRQSLAYPLIQLFYRFDLTVINPEKPWHSVGYGIFCQHDQWMRVTERYVPD